MSTALQRQLEHHRRQVDTDRFDLTVREIVRMATEGELQRAPEYQRKFRWDASRESELIESLLLGLPVPNLFVATNDDATWELVDGLQRVTTLMHFVGDEAGLAAIGKKEPLRLENLTKLTEFNGHGFADLPTTMQLLFQKRPMPIIALSDKSDKVVRFDLFERLNRGAVTLTPQEVRGCIYRGEFNQFLRELAENKTFLSLLKLKKPQKDNGTREEIVLKFFAYLNNRDLFDGRVTIFLNSYMKEASESFDYDASRKTFTSVVKTLASKVNGPILRSTTKVTPINQLEAILVGAGELVSEGKQLSIPSGLAWLNDTELVKHSTKGTNTPAALNARIERARVLFTPRSGTRGRKPS